jgi:hypothetical protein
MDTNSEIVTSGLADIRVFMIYPKKNTQIGSCVNEYFTSFGFGYDVTSHMRCTALFPQMKCLPNNRRYPHLNAGKNAWF